MLSRIIAKPPCNVTGLLITASFLHPPPSGESGSGKTEAFKHIVRHLTARSSPKGFALEPRMKNVS